MRYTKKQIENTYDCVLERHYNNEGKLVWFAFDVDTHEFICDSSTLQKLVHEIPCAKMEHMYG